MRSLLNRLSYHKFLAISSGFLAIAACIFTLSKAVTSETKQESSIFPFDLLFPLTFSDLDPPCLFQPTATLLNQLETLPFTSLVKQDLTSSLTSGDRNFLKHLDRTCKNLADSDYREADKTLANKNSNIFLNNWQDSRSQSLKLAPWPQIHQQAKLAKVPVMMYHDILPKKEVFFDVTPQELEADFKFIKSQGITPISMDWLIAHLRTGIPLPERPVLLTFDDGYGGHYKYVYPLLKKYDYPAVFSIYINKIGSKTGRSGLTWQQLQEMAADPLVTIASHGTTHPDDLRELSDDRLKEETIESKRILEKKLGIPIRYFTYPVGKYDERVKHWVTAAGYRAAFSMDDFSEHFAGDSPDLLTIGRFGQSRLEEIALQAWGGHPLPRNDGGFNFNTPIHREEYTVDGTSLILITGGKPNTIHADSRYQVPEIKRGTGAVAAVDGGFFSLKYLDSNAMIGPVLSQNRGFIPGNVKENLKLKGRPLVLINSEWVKFIPFDPDKHNTLSGILSEASDAEGVTDAFVGAAWLVKNSKPQPAEAFGSLFDFDASRHRAFWGINQAGQPAIGVSKTPVDSVSLGKILHQLGLRDAIMLDSGASTSLAYKGESLVGYAPRPVPHVVALFPPPSPTLSVGHVGLPCVLYADSCKPQK
ncbi:MAG: polysaccharide deacetylase family protein [Hydrococcus sp. C42_A2020_068]|nr:polysaccharide deacetylase family protein [Hydrococcus sp. C42_A2020_068]